MIEDLRTTMYLFLNLINKTKIIRRFVMKSNFQVELDFSVLIASFPHRKVNEGGYVKYRYKDS